MSAARAAVRGRRPAARSTCPTRWRRSTAGRSGSSEPRLFANFVATADGVVAIPSLPQSNKLIAGGSAADRFVMGLLRACADVVVIGSGTLLGSPGGLWTPEQAFPDAADGFAELRAPARPAARGRGGGAVGERLGRSGASGVRRAAGSCSRPTRAPRSSPAGCPPEQVRRARARARSSTSAAAVGRCARAATG